MQKMFGRGFKDWRYPVFFFCSFEKIVITLNMSAYNSHSPPEGGLSAKPIFRFC